MSLRVQCGVDLLVSAVFCLRRCRATCLLLKHVMKTCWVGYVALNIFHIVTETLAQLSGKRLRMFVCLPFLILCLINIT